MAIRIQQYNTPPRRIQAGGIDPGFSNPLIRDAGRSADADVTDAMLKAGMQITEVGIREYVKDQTTAVSEALQEYRAALSTERNRYTKENKGKDAIGAGAYFDGFARDAARPLADRFSGRFREMFMKDAAATGLHFAEQGQSYRRQQKEAWDKSVFEGDMAQTMDVIANDPGNADFVEESLRNLKSRAASMFPGLDRRAMEADLNRKVAGLTIDSFLAKDNVGNARGAFSQYKDLLGAAAPQYEARIKAKGRELEAEARAEQERAQNRLAAENARELLTRFGGDSQQAIEHINATVQDTQERLRLTSAYLTQRNIEDAARQQIRQENIITAQNDIKARIRAAGKDVAALNAIVAEAEPEFKQFALAHAEQAVGGQRRGISDPQAWADAHSAVLRGEPFEIVMGRHVGQLSDPDAERLKTLAEDKAAKEAEAKDDLYFNSLFERSRYAALDPGDKRAARAQLKQEYFERTRGLRTLRERQDVAFQLLHDREVPGPLWWRSTVTSLQAREDEINGKAVRYAVPDDVKERVKKDMEESGISAPTSEEIHNEFINNHKYYEY